MTKWIERFFEFLTRLFDKSPPPPSPIEPDDDPDEFTIAPGVYRTATVPLRGGWVEMEANIPKLYESDERLSVHCLWQMFPTGARKGIGHYASVKAYKIKTCYNTECREPRFPWKEGWRKYRIRWDYSGIVVEVDGLRVSSEWYKRPRGKTMEWWIGDAPNGLGKMHGAKVRNLQWNPS